jgi:hypothetical protein
MSVLKLLPSSILVRGGDLDGVSDRDRECANVVRHRIYDVYFVPGTVELSRQIDGDREASICEQNPQATLVWECFLTADAEDHLVDCCCRSVTVAWEHREVGHFEERKEMNIGGKR